MSSAPNALAEMLVKELEEGVEGGIRPGIIGEIGTERFHVTPAEEKVFRAAARAQRATGASVTTHTTHFGDLAHEQMDILLEEGVPPERIVIGHLGERRGVKGELAIAERGVYVEIDHVGRPASAGTQPEWKKSPKRCRAGPGRLPGPGPDLHGHLRQLPAALERRTRIRLPPDHLRPPAPGGRPHR